MFEGSLGSIGKCTPTGQVAIRVMVRVNVRVRGRALRGLGLGPKPTTHPISYDHDSPAYYRGSVRIRV